MTVHLSLLNIFYKSSVSFVELKYENKIKFSIFTEPREVRKKNKKGKKERNESYPHTSVLVHETYRELFQVYGEGLNIVLHYSLFQRPFAFLSLFLFRIDIYLVEAKAKNKVNYMSTMRRHRVFFMSV